MGRVIQGDGVKVHGVIMALAWTVVADAGVFGAYRRKYKCHMFVMVFVGVAVVGGVGVNLVLVQPDFANLSGVVLLHVGIGFTVLAWMLGQLAIGFKLNSRKSIHS